MWKAELVSVEKKNLMIYPVVRFTDGDTGETFDQIFQGDNIDMTLLAKMAKARINSLQARDTALPTLTLGEIILPADEQIKPI